MFGIGKKNCEVIGSPMEGQTIEITKVKDPTFAQKILGKGIAVIPKEGKVVAPCDGYIEMVFDTKHAISMKTDGGVELLIHVGIDTVTLKGKYFRAHVEAGHHVEAGNLLLEFDIDGITGEGFDIATPIVVCNTKNYKKITPRVGKEVHALDEILTIQK